MIARCCAAALVLSLVALPAPAAAQRGCDWVFDARGMTVTVALRGSAGARLSVNWGDGTASTSRRVLSADGDRAHLVHRYDTPGSYDVVAEAVAPTGSCTSASDAELPAAEEDDDDGDAFTAAILPASGEPTPEADHTFEQPKAMARPVPRAQLPNPEPPRAGVVDTVVRAVRGFLSGLFGGR